MSHSNFQDTDLASALPDLLAAGLTPVAYLDNGVDGELRSMLIVRDSRGTVLLGQDEGCTCCGHAPFADLDTVDFESLDPAKLRTLAARVEEDFDGPYRFQADRIRHFLDAAAQAALGSTPAQAA